MIRWHLDFPSLYSGQCWDTFSLANPDFFPLPLLPAKYQHILSETKTKFSCPVTVLFHIAAEPLERLTTHVEMPTRTRGCHSMMGGRKKDSQPHCSVQIYQKPISRHGLKAPTAPSNSELRLVQRLEKHILELAGCQHQNTLLQLSLAHIGQFHTVCPETLDEEKHFKQRNILILKVSSISAASSSPTDFWIP